MQSAYKDLYDKKSNIIIFKKHINLTNRMLENLTRCIIHGLRIGKIYKRWKKNERLSEEDQDQFYLSKAYGYLSSAHLLLPFVKNSPRHAVWARHLWKKGKGASFYADLNGKLKEKSPDDFNELGELWFGFPAKYFDRVGRPRIDPNDQVMVTFDERGANVESPMDKYRLN